METDSEIHIINEHNFKAAVIGEQKPLLLLCMPHDDQFAEQVNIVMKMATKYSGLLKVGLVEESFIRLFKKKYQIPGTPTFLLLEQGSEKNRSLGLADEQMLTLLVGESCAPTRQG